MRNSYIKPKCVISLTSYQARFPTLHVCLESLFKQSFLGDEIILYLDKDVQNSEILFDIRAFTKMGLKIILTDDMLKCHTKYYYAMQDFPDAVVITVDDDVIYNPKCLETLYSSYIRTPNSISANRVHRILKNKDGSLKPYLDWKFEETTVITPSLDLFATGVGGVLYPPGLLPDMIFNKNLIKKYCLYTDDIWLKFMELLNGIPIVYSGMNPPHPKQITGTKENSLFQQNKTNRINDLCIESLNKLFLEITSKGRIL